MPYYPRKTYRRRRRYTRRPRRMMRRPRRTLPRRALKVHHFKRTFTLTPIASSTLANTFQGYSFNLTQLPNFSEFTTLYDAYRFNKILVRFVPNANSADVGTATQQIPNFHSVIDYNDATTPATLNSLYEYSTWKMSRGTRIHQRIWRPATLDSVDTGAGAVSSSNSQWRQWINTGNANVNHYGLKICAEQGAAVDGIDWVPYVTVYLSCKSVK